MPAHGTYNWDTYYNGNWSLIDKAFTGVTTLLGQGLAGDGLTDDAAKMNAVLSSGALIFDGAGRTYKVNSSVTIPANVTLRNAVIQAGTPGMNVLLVNNYSQLTHVKVIGTGTTNIVERGIYNAADAVTGVRLDGVEVTNLTFAIQAQPITTATLANTPSRWYVNALIHDIVGKVGNSEGYGVLFSPANENEIHIRAYNIARHSLYLSAGAQKNIAFVEADTVYNYAVQLYSTGTQPGTDQNEVHIKARNLSNPTGQTTQSYGIGLIQNANRNTIYADVDSSGATDGAVMVQGDQTTGGYHPADNVVYCTATGIFLHAAVVNSEDAENTLIVNSMIRGRGTTSAINFGVTTGNLYTPKAQGAVLNTTIDGIDSNGFGVTNNSTRGTLSVLALRAINTAQAVVDPNTLRLGYSKVFTKSLTFTSIAAASTSVQTITLPESFSNTNIQATITSLSATVTGLSVVATGWTSTGVTIAFLNGSTATITATVHVRVVGD